MDGTAFVRLRQEAEDQMRETISKWALTLGPSEMTVSQLRELQNQAVHSLNTALHRRWDGEKEELRKGRKPQNLTE